MDFIRPDQSRPNKSAENKEESGVDISSGLEIQNSEKEGRFLNYWLTTTITTTLTSYTATSSVASLICTPAGYTNDGCPGTG